MWPRPLRGRFIGHPQEESVLYVCTKFEADSIYSFKSYKGPGPKISKLGHVPLSHAPFEPLTLNLCIGPKLINAYSLLTATYILLTGESNVNGPLMAKLAMHMRRVTWPGGRGRVIQNHIFGYRDPNLPIHYITFMGLQRRLRRVYIWFHPHCKAVLDRKFSKSRHKWAQNGGF